MYAEEAYELLTKGFNRHKLLRDVSQNNGLSARLLDKVITEKNERNILLNQYNDYYQFEKLITNRIITKEEAYLVYNKQKYTNPRYGLTMIKMFDDFPENEIIRTIESVIKTNDMSLWRTILYDKISQRIDDEKKNLVVDNILKNVAHCFSALNTDSGKQIVYRRKEILDKAISTGKNAYELFINKRYINNEERLLLLDKALSVKSWLSTLVRNYQLNIKNKNFTEADKELLITKIVEVNDLTIIESALSSFKPTHEEKERLENVKLMLVLSNKKR